MRLNGGAPLLRVETGAVLRATEKPGNLSAPDNAPIGEVRDDRDDSYQKI
jgi:hypothetical protein